MDAKQNPNHMSTGRTNKPEREKKQGLSVNARAGNSIKKDAKARIAKSSFLCGSNVMIQALPPTIENWEPCEWIAMLAGAGIGHVK